MPVCALARNDNVGTALAAARNNGFYYSNDRKGCPYRPTTDRMSVGRAPCNIHRINGGGVRGAIRELPVADTAR